jgi:hypothetical protein
MRTSEFRDYLVQDVWKGLDIFTLRDSFMALDGSSHDWQDIASAVLNQRIVTRLKEFTHLPEKFWAELWECRGAVTDIVSSQILHGSWEPASRDSLLRLIFPSIGHEGHLTAFDLSVNLQARDGYIGLHQDVQTIYYGPSCLKSWTIFHPIHHTTIEFIVSSAESTDLLTPHAFPLTCQHSFITPGMWYVRWPELFFTKETKRLETPQDLTESEFVYQIHPQFQAYIGERGWTMLYDGMYAKTVGCAVAQGFFNYTLAIQIKVNFHFLSLIRKLFSQRMIQTGECFQEMEYDEVDQ